MRLVHLGLGNFFRAHQAWYTTNASNAAEWGIAAFTGRSTERSHARVAALRSQDGLYTLITRAADGDRFQVVRSLARVHLADEHTAWLAYLADPQVQVITTTVTEAGYLRGPESALPQLLAGGGTPRQKNAALPGVHRRIDAAIAALEGAKTALRPIPAKVLATDLDPDAQRARPHLGRRVLQMVLRLLAFSAEAWLAEHINAYLADPNEYRAILRNLLHLGGHVDYTTKAITITLDRPVSPRIARALQLLTGELNATPATMPGDHRPLACRLAAA